MNNIDKIRKALNTGDASDLLTAMEALAELERAAAEPVAYCNGDNLNIGIPLRFQAFTRQQAFASTPLYAAPPAPVAEIREPTPEECERIYSFWIGAEGCSGRTPGERMGRIMFDACRAVMWPKEGL